MAEQNKLEQLDLLYQLVSAAEKLGKPFPEEYLTEITELEEQLIKQEVLPLIHDNIEPTLRRVQRPLVLVVEYDPNGALKVSLSRKVNVAATISDAKEITPDPIVEHTEKKKGGKKVVTQPSTRLRITMSDGSVFEEHTAWETLHQFVLKVGIDRVREVGLIANKIPLVSNRVDEKYKSAQKPLGNGWYLMTCSDTRTKKKQIEAIASTVGIKVKVDII